MTRLLRTFAVFAAITVPLAFGCVATTAGADEPEADQSSIAPVERATANESEAALPQDFTCRPPVQLRCQAGCCLLINNFTSPPTLSCNDCR